MKTCRSLLLAAVVMSAACWASAQDRVVYHFDNTEVQALKGLRNIRNHLDNDPKARIAVVAHADGVDFLMEGKKDRWGNDYAPLVEALSARGVSFEVCEITLLSRKLARGDFIPETRFTPSGVVRIAKLQTQEGAAYIKP